jgi:hypothetical protein
MTGHVDFGAVMSFVALTENVSPGPLVKLKLADAEAPEPFIANELLLIVIGCINVLGNALALNRKLSIA